MFGQKIEISSLNEYISYVLRNWNTGTSYSKQN